jgi:hypothetical protein
MKASTISKQSKVVYRISFENQGGFSVAEMERRAKADILPRTLGDDSTSTALTKPIYMPPSDE